MKGKPGPSWTVHVKVPPDKAYAYVADLSRHAEWSFAADKMTIKADKPGPAVVGSKYSAEGNLMGRNASKVTITALTRQRVWSSSRRIGRALMATGSSSPPRTEAC